MNFQLPIGLIAIVIALYIFYSISRRNRLIREERKNARNEVNNRRQAILDQLIKSKENQTKDSEIKD